MTLKQSEQEALICIYENGDDIQTNIKRETGRSMNTVASALNNLEEYSLIKDKGRGVYTLTSKGEQIAESLSKIESSTS